MKYLPKEYPDNRPAEVGDVVDVQYADTVDVAVPVNVMSGKMRLYGMNKKGSSFHPDLIADGDGWSSPKESVKDYASFLSDFKANLLGTDEVVSYLQDNTDMDSDFVDKVRYHEVSKEEIIKVLEKDMGE